MRFLKDDEIKALQPYIQTLQVIIGALAMGAISFLCITLVFNGGPKSWELGMLPLIGIVFGGLTIVGWLVFPFVFANMATDGSASQSDTDDANIKAFMKLQTLTIIRGAMVEGGVFCNLLLFFVEGNGLNIVAALVGLFFLILLFPTKSRVLPKIESLRR